MTEQINEFLKTCRFYYRMLVTVCVAALLFAIAPSDTQRLQQAIQEAELVSVMDFAQLFNKGVKKNDEVEVYINKMAAVMSQAEIVEVEGSDHVLFWDKPDEFNRIVKEFLAG